MAMKLAVAVFARTGQKFGGVEAVVCQLDFQDAVGGLNRLRGRLQCVGGLCGSGLRRRFMTGAAAEHAVEAKTDAPRHHGGDEKNQCL